MVDGLVSTRLTLASKPAWRGITGRARRARSGPLLAMGAGAVALGIGTVALATGVLDGPPAPGVAGADLAPTVTPGSIHVATPSPRPSEAPSLTPSPVPVSVPSAAPTPASTIAPTAAPTAQPVRQTYTVVQGDTLGSIAQRFGTTVETLQAANGIANPNTIVVGRVLVLP